MAGRKARNVPSSELEQDKSSVPRRTLAERMEALRRANSIRVRRSTIKREIKAGRLSVVDLILEPPDELLTAKVFDLLLAVPRFGRVKVNRLLTQASISPSKTIGGLSERQRSELAKSLADLEPGASRRHLELSPEPALERLATDQRVASFAEQELTRTLRRLLGDREPSRASIERAARIVAAEEAWREGIGVLLNASDVSVLLGVSNEQLGDLEERGDLIVLENRDGDPVYPALQFHDARPSPTLAGAHRMLVEKGHVSPWTAASWARTRHPELEERSPTQWIGEQGDADLLLRIAERDAARLAQ